MAMLNYQRGNHGWFRTKHPLNIEKKVAQKTKTRRPNYEANWDGFNQIQTRRSVTEDWKWGRYSISYIHTHRMHGAAIYGNIYHQYTPFMIAYIPAPWIPWDIYPPKMVGQWWLTAGFRGTFWGYHIVRQTLIYGPFKSVSKPCTPGEHQNSW